MSERMVEPPNGRPAWVTEGIEAFRERFELHRATSFLRKWDKLVQSKAWEQVDLLARSLNRDTVASLRRHTAALGLTERPSLCDVLDHHDPHGAAVASPSKAEHTELDHASRERGARNSMER